MCSKTEHVIELLYMPETIRWAHRQVFALAGHAKAATYLEHMFEIQAKCRYIRPYER